MNLWHILPSYDFDAYRGLAVSEARQSHDGHYPVIDGVAVIEISGPTSKRGEDGATSTMGIRNQVRQAINDHAVEGMFLAIDSPGGAVSGNLELANDVAEASKRMPTMSYASDMMASAAYEVGAQAMATYANESALVGSIGTMMQMYDSSKLFESVGIRPVSITSGGMKGVGAPGVPIEQEHVDYFQQIIDQMTNQFVGAVASGRKVHPSQAAQWADGRVHVAAQAAQLGLIDGVMPMDQAFSFLRSQL